DGASLSTIVEEGEPVDTAGSKATTSAIRAITLEAGRSTLGGGVSNSSNNGLNKICQSVLEGGTYDVEGGGFGTSPELIVAGVIS
nr:hypothetical protein [Tanacetum cinerariifolium]